MCKIFYATTVPIVDNEISLDSFVARNYSEHAQLFSIINQYTVGSINYKCGNVLFRVPNIAGRRCVVNTDVQPI